MSLSKNETIKLAETAVNAVNNYTSKVASIIGELGTLKGDLGTIGGRITESIIAEDINKTSDSSIEKISMEIDKALGLAQDALATAVENCNNYIEYLQASFNDGLEEGEELLSLNGIKATLGVAAGASAASGGSGLDTSSSGSTSSSSSGSSNNPGYNSGTSGASNTSTPGASTPGTSTTPAPTDNGTDNNDNDNNNNSSPGNSGNTNTPSIDELDSYLNSIFERNLVSDIDSKYIDNWDEKVKKFLVKNNLDNVIDKISVSNHQVICETTTGNKKAFDNINSVNDLLRSIKNTFINNSNTVNG